MSFIENKYRCPECRELYDSMDAAVECFLDCCDLEIEEVWICPECREKYGSEDAALECLDSHRDASAPNHMTMADRAALEQAGQCRLF